MEPSDVSQIPPSGEEIEETGQWRDQAPYGDDGAGDSGRGRRLAAVRPGWVAAGLIALLVLALLIYGLMAQPGKSLQVGTPVSSFQLTDLDGAAMSLDAQRGKVTVLNFFASWCSPCQEEAPALEQVWRDYKDQGVQFLGIAYKDAAPKAAAFLDSFDVTYPSALDPGGRTAQAYGVTGVPETFVIDQDGRLVRHFIGSVTREGLARELDKLLNQ
jgi:cytochrome c biogenesis protein CcmG/thiol:disulfide interchange protein DsbE